MSQFCRICATTSETPYNHACYNLTGSALNMETAYFPSKKKKKKSAKKNYKKFSQIAGIWD